MIVSGPIESNVYLFVIAHELSDTSKKRFTYRPLLFDMRWPGFKDKCNAKQQKTSEIVTYFQFKLHVRYIVKVRNV